MSDRVELFKTASDATLLVIASEERVYVCWKEVGIKWRQYYKSRDEMVNDRANLLKVIIGGFSELQRELYNNSADIRASSPKKLSMSQNKKRASALAVERRIFYYYEKTMDATYPTDAS
jgi:hypothetical protein